MKKTLILLFIFSITIFAQNIVINKIEPPNWWSGMKHNNIQLMVYGENLENISAKFAGSSLKVLKVHKTENPSYLFIDISIRKNASPKDYELILSKANQKVSIQYPILKRERGGERFQGFNTKDVIYLLMPDRFSNGDTKNDSIVGYSDYLSRTPNQARAGGDLQGMINKLDYLKELGITAIWPTPLTENNTFRSYHGYATTDFYKIDPRIGTNELYKKFVDESHKRRIKVILDHVANHFSDDHVWMKNPPTKDWTNGTKENHRNANHNKMVFTDPYSDSSTIKHVEQGWFVSSMPDLNHENPFVANYIIQNTIWWMEYAGLDGIREDTYPYNNQKYIAGWAKSLLDEFPTINIVGEVWSGNPEFLAGYQMDTFLPRKFNTNLPAITDFGLRDVLVRYLQGKDRLYNIYELLAKDYLYKDPNNLVTFIDNHDVARVMYFANGDIAKAKNAYSVLFTTRGIPQIFYGSEIGLVGTDDHGTLRIPFPGGFPNDTRNAFIEKERTQVENEIFNHVKELISLRKKYPALAEGKLTHFIPSDNVYVYFRTSKSEKMMIVLSDNESEVSLPVLNYASQFKGYGKLQNVKSGNSIDLNNTEFLKVSPKQAAIYLLK